MNRSEFIKSIGLSASGIILPSAFINKKSIKIYDNYVKGLEHYHFKKLKKQIKEGDLLTLHRDTENIYDSFAITINYQENKFGYLPAYENIVLANMMDAEVKLTAFVSKLNLKSSIYEAMAVEVYAELVIPTDKLIQTTLTDKRAGDAVDVYRYY